MGVRFLATSTCLAFVVAAGWGAPLAAQQTSERVADHVRSALEAGAAGDSAAREQSLAEARKLDPLNAPARWHSGEVRFAGLWLPIERAPATQPAPEIYTEYQRRRAESENDASLQLGLAQWCAENGLAAQARAHALAGSNLEASDPRKQREREMRQIAATRQQRKQSKADAIARKELERKSKDRIEKWIRDAESKNSVSRDVALSQFRSLRDPQLLGLAERALIKSSAPAQLAYLDAIKSMQTQGATDAIVRAAVLSNHAEVRKAATKELKLRSLFGYVPTLMAALRPPLEVDFRQYVSNGRAMHRLNIYEEGPVADRLFSNTDGESYHWASVTTTNHNTHTHTYRRQGISTTSESTKTSSNASSSYIPDATLALDASRAQAALQQNVIRAQLNQRVMPVLRETTGYELADSPQEWYDWWYDYNEVYQPPYKPVEESVSYVAPSAPTTYADYRETHSQTHTYSSCFVAGTPVLTFSGPVAIERIKPGDLVLGQDVESGELAYRPVLGTTTRPPSELVDVRAGGTLIQVTRGHPFWVCGIGWQMAKELKPGQFLHTPRGPLQIESVGKGLEAECFNLIVADFHNYFISDAQALVHDNNIREVTSAVVPGLVNP